MRCNFWYETHCSNVQPAYICSGNLRDTAVEAVAQVCCGPKSVWGQIFANTTDFKCLIGHACLYLSSSSSNYPFITRLLNNFQPPKNISLFFYFFYGFIILVKFIGLAILDISNHSICHSKLNSCFLRHVRP